MPAEPFSVREIDLEESPEGRSGLFPITNVGNTDADGSKVRRSRRMVPVRNSQAHNRARRSTRILARSSRARSQRGRPRLVRPPPDQKRAPVRCGALELAKRPQS
jgi:hypothetical protein